MKTFTTLVVGATGATGRFVVQQLLAQGLPVKVIVRSKDRMLEALGEANCPASLTITEGSLVEMTDEQLQKQVSDVDAIVSCLGHNLTFKGIWGKPRRLVTDAVGRLAQACGSKSVKFILMSSDGVSLPNDDRRNMAERTVLFLLRHLIPPHADNEQAAQCLQRQATNVQWIGVRPTDLIDAPTPSEYTIYDKPIGGLFGSGAVARINVAKFMVDLLTDEMLFQSHKGKFPVIHNAINPETTKKTD